MEDKNLRVCTTCNRSLPLTAFCKTRMGRLAKVCNTCRASKSAQTRNKRRAAIEGMTFPEFDGKSPQEVITIMAWAKAWLSQQGYDVKLSGEFREVKVRPIKFEL